MNTIQILKTKIDENDSWEKEINLKRNELLKRKGSKDTSLYYIEEGSVQIYFEDGAEQHIIRLGYQGNIFGALDSFVSESSSELCIRAIKKCRVKKITKSKFMALVKGDPAILEVWHEILSLLVYQQIEREKDILVTSPKKRYQRVLKRSPQLFQEIPNKYIASYLRMTPETLSRLKKS